MGEVQVFREHLYLKSLDLSFTNVTGDAEVFSSKSGITTLKLASTGVSGEIGVLVSGTIHNTLMVLDLSSTKVVGNIWVFQHAKALNELYLANTQVTGSMDGILLWKYVKVIDLSHTMVHGRLTQRWRGCCRWLRSLKLSEGDLVTVNAGLYSTQSSCVMIDSRPSNPKMRVLLFEYQLFG